MSIQSNEYWFVREQARITLEKASIQYPPNCLVTGRYYPVRQYRHATGKPTFFSALRRELADRLNANQHHGEVHLYSVSRIEGHNVGARKR